MNMRAEITRLLELGPLPSEDAEPETIAPYEELLGAIKPPVSNEEGGALLSLFGPDDCFGLAWSLLHLIESAPGWPLPKLSLMTSNEWIELLRHRVENAHTNREVS